MDFEHTPADEDRASDSTHRREPKSASSAGASSPPSAAQASTFSSPPTPSKPPPLSAGSSHRQTNIGELVQPPAPVEPGLEDAKTVIRKPGKSPVPPIDRAARTPAEIAKVLVGEQLNQYFLEALIGGGGMGAVFRAHDQRLDRIVALKVVPFVGNDPELGRRFRNEAQNAAKLDHPRIARVFDAGDYDDWHYIVFEYIDGINLRDLVQDHGVLSLDDAVVFTSQVAEALDHAAQRGIVHRDIKPSNVLVSGDGSVKLVDMGLARSDNLDLSEDMTASGVTLGTFDYISPEQAFDPRDADIRSDLYSLGCTLYFMLTGEPPYTGGTMLQKLISHGKTPPPDPRSLRPDLPDEVIAVMHRMMAKNPETRYQNARDLLADLNELAYRYGLKRAQSNAVVTLPPSNEGLQRLQMHLPWMIAFLLVLMVGGYLELQSTADRDAFVIPRPIALPRVSTSSNTVDRENGDAESNELNPVLPDESPLDQMSSSADLQSDVASQGNGGRLTPGGMEETANDRINQTDVASDVAARPPRFNGRLPLPTSSDPLANVSRTMAQDLIGPMPDAESAAPVKPNADPDTERSRGGDGVVADASAEADPNRSAFDLPKPQAVRIVAPGVLSVAMRVDQVDRDTDDGAVLASTLADAVDLAMRFGVGRIEIDVPDLVTGPVVIPQDNMVFLSTVGRSHIRMVSVDTRAIGRSEMLNIGNHRTEFKNLDFHWELSQDQVDGGAMFVVNDTRLTRFQNCTLTLVNKSIQDGVSFFRIVTDPEALPDSETLPGRMFNPNENALPFVALQFDNVIIRGEADLIEMDYAAALQLAWKNGLLAITGSGIQTSGALRGPASLASPIQLSLSNLTAEIPRGLLNMDLGTGGSFPVPIEREANQCVFLVEEGQPLIQVDHLESLSNDRPYIKLRGSDNAYVGTASLNDPVVLLSDRQGGASVMTMSDLADSEDELRPGRSVRWSTPTPRPNSQIYHRLTPADYRQDGAILFGFQELDLPPIP